jgi:rhamnogalacturonyl hydrolase YesR
MGNNKARIMADMVRANEYFLAKYPDPGADADPTHAGNIWTKSTYLEGLMALYGISGDRALYDYAVAWGNRFNWNARSGDLTTNADDQCCMQVFCELYINNPVEAWIAHATACMDTMCAAPAVDYWTWIDAIHMSMPVFAKLGAMKGATKYFEKMHLLFRYTKSTLGLYNATDRLWWRDSSFTPPFATPNGKHCYWSRGNGWVFAALARVLQVLPDSDAHRGEYLATFKEMAAALKDCQRSDGFWNPSLLDPQDYGGKETSGTAFFTFGMAWGINRGFLDMAAYLTSVENGWNGMVTHALHDNGFLGWVQGTGKQPSDGQPLLYDRAPNFEDFALGAFLLAGSEVYKLAPPSPTPSRR